MLWLLLQFRAQNPDSVCLLKFWGEVPLYTKTYQGSGISSKMVPLLVPSLASLLLSMF